MLDRAYSQIVTAAHPANPPHMNDSNKLSGLAAGLGGVGGGIALLGVGGVDEELVLVLVLAADMFGGTSDVKSGSGGKSKWLQWVSGAAVRWNVRPSSIRERRLVCNQAERVGTDAVYGRERISSQLPDGYYGAANTQIRSGYSKRQTTTTAYDF